MNTFKIDLLSKKYKNKEALKNVSFKLESGEIVGVIGKNGAGKTTLFNLIAGNINKNSGDIYYNNKKLEQNDEIHREFGILIKPVFYEYMKGLEFLEQVDKLNKETHTMNEISQILDMVGLSDAKNKTIKSYSFGMKQRLMFANALLGANKLLMLDEPFVGLDINARNIVKEYIRNISKSKAIPVLFSDHNLDEVMDLCTRIIILNDGEKVYDGNLEKFKEEITVTVDSTKELDSSLYCVLNEKKVVIKKEMLDKTLREILKYCKVKNIENINVLNSLLNGGGKDA